MNTATTITLDQRAQCIRNLVGMARTSIIAIGNELIAAKSEMEHGQWLPWLEANFQWTDRTARRFMRVAQAFKSDTVSKLDGVAIDARALYFLSSKSVPEEVRTAALELAKKQPVTLIDAKKMVTVPHVTSTTVPLLPDGYVPEPEPEPEPVTLKVGDALLPRKNLAEELDALGDYLVGLYDSWEDGKLEEVRSHIPESIAGLKIQAQGILGLLQDLEECMVSDDDDREKAGKRRLSEYHVKFTFKASNIASVRKQLVTAFPSAENLEVERPSAQGRSRADRLSMAESEFERAKGTVSELKDEIESWKDNLPENFQQGEKADALEACIEALEELHGSLEEVSGWDEVNFPDMMG